MSVYMTRINGLSFNDTMQYRQCMAIRIAQRLGIKEMGIYRCNLSAESAERLSARVDGIIAGINRGDIIICQFPTWNGLRFEWELIDHLKVYGGRVAILIHELEMRQPTLSETISLYNQAEILIVPTLAMQRLLLDNGIKKNMKFVIQEMYDYISNFSFSYAPAFKKEFAFIGDGEQKEIEKWSSALPLRIYGVVNVAQRENVYKISDMNQDEVFTEISRGGFGLVWYKNEYDCQYMEYIASFSMAKFLAAGIPVIVPEGISNQALIKANHLGLIVHCLEEAVSKVEAMDEIEYQGYVQCVGRFAPALRNGYYMERCLIEAMQAFYREDAGRFYIPMKVYSLEKSDFSFTVLKESYGENLALSWRYQGKTDGFLIYDDVGRLVAETNNVYQHYCLIKNYGKENSFIVKAYIETLRGKLVVAESELTCLDARIYENPKVSLIVPAYNVEEYVVRSIDTALAQSFPNLEIIIVDDGSTDDTPHILDWYAEKYLNVKVIHKENGGVSTARNEGIVQAKGEYIGFMDSDDMIYPDMIAKLYYSAKKNDCDIAITSTHYISDNSYNISLFSQYSIEENIAVDINRFMNSYCVNAYQAPVVWNKLYHASLVKKRPFPLIVYEDEAWIPYILSFAERVCYLDEGLYEYDDTHKNSLSDKCSQKTGDEIFLNHKRAILFYLENGNPVIWERLKEVAHKELFLFARIYKNVEYENLWKQITENGEVYISLENKL